MPKDLPIDEIRLDEIQSFDAFCKRYPDIANEARLRWWIYHRQANGLQASGAIVKRAGRWYIVVPRIKNWLLQAA
jgi:hypothetical protein